MKDSINQVSNDEDYLYDRSEKLDVPEIDYKMECKRLWEENHTQDTIIKALVFYIQEGNN